MKQKTNYMLIFTSLTAYFTYFIHEMCIRDRVKTMNIYISVRMMKILTNFMVCDDHGRKRRILGKLLRLGGCLLYTTGS